MKEGRGGGGDNIKMLEVLRVDFMISWGDQDKGGSG